MASPGRSQRFRATDFVIAAVSAPLVATASFLLVGAIGLKMRPDIALHGGDAEMVLIAATGAVVWGSVLAAVFGGAVLGALLAISDPRRPPGWVYTVGGVVAVGLNLGLAVALAKGFGLAGLILAPWFVVWMMPGGPSLFGPAATVCVFLGGAAGGWIYERRTRGGADLNYPIRG